MLDHDLLIKTAAMLEDEAVIEDARVELWKIHGGEEHRLAYSRALEFRRLARGLRAIWTVRAAKEHEPGHAGDVMRSHPPPLRKRTKE